MFNVAIFKLKDITKYLVVITIIIFIAITTTRFFSMKKETQITIPTPQIYKKAINSQIPAIEGLEKEQNNELNREEHKYAQIAIGTEISAIKSINQEEAKITQETNNSEEKNTENQQTEAKTEQNSNNENNQNNNVNNKEEKNEEVKTGQETQIVTNNPIKETYNTQYGKVKIKNGTKINLTEEIMTPNISIENKNILIFHTHSCESYTSSNAFPYTPTGTYRTTDLNYTVTRVGTELESQLKKYNIPVTHNTSYHDYPSYNGSYTRSLATVTNILKTTPSDIIIDLHRDAIGSRSDYAPTVKIGEDYAAQIMYVIGTNQGGLEHPNWQQNLKFAIKVQEKAEEMFPGLFKPIMLTEYRYNQHAGKYASIMEVGATGNTLEQCLTSMKYLAKVLDEVIK